MIQSETLNNLMVEKVAYGIADLKSDAKGWYRYGKQSTGVLKSNITEPLSDLAQVYEMSTGESISEKKIPFVKTYTDSEIDFKNRRAVKNMDSIASQHGYSYQGNNTWHNPNTNKTFRLDDVAPGFSHTTMSGPHMMPKEIKPRVQKVEGTLKKVLTPVFDKLNVPNDLRDFNLAQQVGANDVDTIRIGKTGTLRTKGVLSHEFGHHLQGSKMRKLDTIARFTAQQAPRLAALNTAVGPFTYGLPATMAINKGLAATTAAAGATVAGSELQASYLGSKHLKNNIRHRSRAFVGIPTYVAGAITGPRSTLKNNVEMLKKLVKLK